MNIEQIIRSWKNSEETAPPVAPENPVGNELSDQELITITGGMPCTEVFSCSLWDTEITTPDF